MDYKTHNFSQRYGNKTNYNYQNHSTIDQNTKQQRDQPARIVSSYQYRKEFNKSGIFMFPQILN